MVAGTCISPSGSSRIASSTGRDMHGALTRAELLIEKLAESRKIAMDVAVDIMGRVGLTLDGPVPIVVDALQLLQPDHFGLHGGLAYEQEPQEPVKLSQQRCLFVAPGF